MYTKEFIHDYSEVLKFSFFRNGESGMEVAIESTERHSDLAVESMKYLEKEIQSGEVSIEEPHAEQLLDFVETVYKLCIHQEGAQYHRRDLEELMLRLAADKEAKAS